MSSKTLQQPPAAVVTFRPDFCSPGYLNGLLRLQPLHWLEIRRREAAATVSAFEFVIPACQSNLVCVLGTEIPFLEAELGCRVCAIPVPEYVAPDGLKAFRVEYSDQLGPQQAAHGKFLASLASICYRLSLSKICTDPAGDCCLACASVRKHTKSVRGISATRPRLRQARQPAAPLTLDLTRPRMRRPASAEAAKSFAGGDARDKNAATAAAEREMTEATVNTLQERLFLMMLNAATDEAALLTTATAETLCVCSGGSSRHLWHWQYSLDTSVALMVADTVLMRERLHEDTIAVFADWAAELPGRLLSGCVHLAADVVASGHAAAARTAEAIAVGLLCRLSIEVAAEIAESGQPPLVRVCVPCDWRTSRTLLGLQRLERRCLSCSARICAEPVGTAGGYRLIIRSCGRRCSRHGSLLQLADCARSSRDAALGGLLLQEVAALPSK